MTTTEIFSKLTDIMRDVFDDGELVAVPQMTAADVDGWDSLSNVRLIMTTEKPSRSNSPPRISAS